VILQIDAFNTFRSNIPHLYRACGESADRQIDRLSDWAGPRSCADWDAPRWYRQVTQRRWLRDCKYLSGRNVYSRTQTRGLRFLLFI